MSKKKKNTKKALTHTFFPHAGEPTVPVDLAVQRWRTAKAGDVGETARSSLSLPWKAERKSLEMLLRRAVGHLVRYLAELTAAFPPLVLPPWHAHEVSICSHLQEGTWCRQEVTFPPSMQIHLGCAHSALVQLLCIPLADISVVSL